MSELRKVDSRLGSLPGESREEAKNHALDSAFVYLINGLRKSRTGQHPNA